MFEVSDLPGYFSGDVAPLVLFMTAISAAVVVFLLPRIYNDWLSFHRYRTEQDLEKLQELLLAEKQWVLRHFVCAAAAVAMTAILLKQPGWAGLATATAGYAVVSSMLAIIESLFVQKLADAVVAGPGRTPAGR